MPVRAIVQVWKYQCNEVVVLLVATAHDVVDEAQALYCFLPDYVLAVCQFLYNLRDVLSECRIGEAPALILRKLILHYLRVALALLRHA